MTGIDLLRPRWLAMRGRWLRAGGDERRRSLALAALGLFFWAVVFWFFTRVLGYFQGIPELGPVLAERLLGMVLLSFFSILLFSNIVTALSTYYLSADLGLLLASPIRPAALHTGRFAETLWDSSWMIVLFGLPIFPYTVGLLNSIPRLDTQAKYLVPIKGSVCNMMDPPRGCKFHPRCTQAMDVCREEIPKLREIAPGHFAACHLHGRG